MKTLTNYHPQYFLSSLGAGGLAVTFFMYLMFMTIHETPIPTFNTLSVYFESGNIAYMSLIVLSILGIIYFAIRHYILLIWNLKQFFIYKKTSEYKKLLKTNAEVSLMTIPLTLAMSINVGFILGAVFVPGLWNIVEYLFPAAIVAFLLIGILALRIFTNYFSRIIHNGFDFTQNNNLSQMIAVMAFAMIGVGLAASAAMSDNILTVSLAMLASIFFTTLSLFFGSLKLILGFKSMLRHGLAVEASPTFWVIIPILTLLGITYVRMQHGIHTGLGMHTEPGNLFLITSIFLSLQIIFGYLGYKVMRENKYFTNFIHGDKKSAQSYALICPGVALVVFGFFFLHVGLIKNGVLEKFSFIYFLLLLPLIYIQLKTILTMLKLNKKLLS